MSPSVYRRSDPSRRHRAIAAASCSTSSWISASNPIRIDRLPPPGVRRAELGTTLRESSRILNLPDLFYQPARVAELAYPVRGADPSVWLVAHPSILRRGEVHEARFRVSWVSRGLSLPWRGLRMVRASETGNGGRSIGAWLNEPRPVRVT